MKEEEHVAYYTSVLEDVQKYGISGGGMTPQTTSVEQQTAEIPGAPDLRKLHWTAAANLVYVFTKARREFVDEANDEKERMVYKKHEPQPQQQQLETHGEPSAQQSATAKEIIADDSDDDEDEAQGSDAMVVEADEDDEDLFVKQRPDYEARFQTRQENLLVSLVDEWIQHMDATKGLALSNKDIEAMELF
ncbi:hypothetical protein PG997_015055 [Apiospora hydei]|uniref:Uncharacterized protein n=1 Tax=Apiospora hydei TaxID=1337664 RepID=A0ABR1UYT6_9PEZI